MACFADCFLNVQVGGSSGINLEFAFADNSSFPRRNRTRKNGSSADADFQRLAGFEVLSQDANKAEKPPRTGRAPKLCLWSERASLGITAASALGGSRPAERCGPRARKRCPSDIGLRRTKELWAGCGLA